MPAAVAPGLAGPVRGVGGPGVPQMQPMPVAGVQPMRPGVPPPPRF